MTCSCARLKVGGEGTELRNWNPECPVHGTASAWWKSPEQQAKREAQNARLRDLRLRATAARRKTAGVLVNAHLLNP